MKQLTRLISYKTKKSKTNIKTYNPFDTGGGGAGGGGVSTTPTNIKREGDKNKNTLDNGDDEISHSPGRSKTSSKTRRLEPVVHKYHKTNEATSTTTTKPLNATNLAKMKMKGGGHKLLFFKKPSHGTTSSSRSPATASTAGVAAATKSPSSKCNTTSSNAISSKSINYTSLNRMRNNSNASSCASHSIECRQAAGRRRRKWQFLLWKCCRNRKRKSHQQRFKQHPSSSSRQNTSQRHCWASLRKFWLRCRHRRSASSYPYVGDDDDDDIDAKFAAYIMEMKEREAKEDKEAEMQKAEQEAVTDHGKSPKSMTTTNNSLLPSNSTNPLRISSNSALSTKSLTPPSPAASKLTQNVCSSLMPTAAGGNKVSFAHDCGPGATASCHNLIQRRHSQHQIRGNGAGGKSRRAWTWDDSLRSNSDRFLETLEEDAGDFVMIKECIIETASTSVNSSRASVTRTRPALQDFLSMGGERISNVVDKDNDDVDDGLDVVGDFVIVHGEEAKAAAEELSRSPVMGQRNYDPASSPLQSRGSGSSENWPQQSDEDIDRLVAMHQNRSSLSSLGLRSDSMASVYSGAGEGRYGTVVVKGQVEFAMQYNYKLGALEIHVVRCKDLAAVDAKRNRSDPYVKVYLLPDKSKAGKRKTKVKKHTLNPIFDEVLRFHMPISSLESRTLWLTVWHSDMFGRNDFLGEVSVNLQGRVFDNPQSQWYLLQERSEPFDEVATYRGDIVVGLKYVPPEGTKTNFMRSSTSSSGGGLRKFGSIKSVAISKSDRSAKGGQLHVLVKEAKHLTPIKPNGTCDAFCKSYLLPDRTRSSKQKTPIVKRSTNPNWTYTIVYEDVTLEDLSERALELTVWDHDRLASNEFLGGVRFSLGTGKSYGRIVDWMDASGKELSLWQNMLDRPNFWVEGSVVLRSSLDGIRAIP